MTAVLAADPAANDGPIIKTLQMNVIGCLDTLTAGLESVGVGERRQ